MNKTILSAAILLSLSLAACTGQTDPGTPAGQTDKAVNKSSRDMNNLVSIVEIPTIDFARAVAFYQAIMDTSIEEVDMGGIQMGVLPCEEGSVNVALINGSDYRPSADGTIVYLNAGDDLQIVLDRVEPNGGKLIVPKTEIGPDMGFFALFTDTEGNKLGLHSIR